MLETTLSLGGSLLSMVFEKQSPVFVILQYCQVLKPPSLCLEMGLTCLSSQCKYCSPIGFHPLIPTRSSKVEPFLKWK